MEHFDELDTPNNRARKHFWAEFTYDDITLPRFGKLFSILEKHIEKRNEIESKKVNRDYVYTLRTKDCIFKPKTARHPYFEAYIKVLCDNYSLREAISFNSNEWIGFAGWASSYNTVLFTDAFEEWLDWLRKDLTTS